MKVTQTIITPPMAHELLALNEGNRNVRRLIVNAYARDMENGNWSMCHNPIVIGAGGHIVNGQHRLYAVIKSGVSIPALLINDDSLQSATDYVGDYGFKRSSSFDIGITTIQAAVARSIFEITTGNTSGVTRSDTEAIWNHIKDDYMDVFPVHQSRRLIMTKYGMAGALAAAVDTGDKGYVRDQMSAMARDDFKDMSSATASLYKQIAIDGRKFERTETTARFYRVMLPKFRDVYKFQIKDESAAYAAVVSSLKRYINGEK